MCSKELRNVLIALNNVCKNHAKLNYHYAPKINTTLINKEDINVEIKKMLHYLEFPYYSHLNKNK
mgnify:CR=1 FL=1